MFHFASGIEAGNLEAFAQVWNGAWLETQGSAMLNLHNSLASG